MKQLYLSVAGGAGSVGEVPAPRVQPGTVLVKSAVSLVSAGTERMVVEFAEKSLVKKARSRPDLARQVLDKARREGVLSTLGAVRNRLDQPMALGYSCAGSVIDVGDGIATFKIGDRVACAGGGYAVHAEVVCVPKNLVVTVPESVAFESAAFTTLGAIALQGIRLAEVKLGEVVAVIGLGLLGQLTVQMLKASGCLVVGMDIQPGRAELARNHGADAVATTAKEFAALCSRFSTGHGADAVLITAGTRSNQPLTVAGGIARNKGIVVAVGAVGMTVPRKVYYEKELDFRISRSYGPGRYDPGYEEKGHDYPIGYVRWTENRNMQAFVQLLAERKVAIEPLITHRFPIEKARKAYDLITGKTGDAFLGVLITYPEQGDLARRVPLVSESACRDSGVRHPGLEGVSVGVLGAGNFATTTLLPAMKKVPGIAFAGVCDAVGLRARHVGDKYGFRYCATDENEILNDPDVNTVAIATRHSLHARQVMAALNAGKNVFCEKPLAMREGELQEIVRLYCSMQRSEETVQQGSRERETGSAHGPVPLLTVGYNRRFAPLCRRLKRFRTALREPLVMQYRVNAGYIPPDHWVHDPEQGGGRIIGEVCHFVDLLTFLAQSLPVRVLARALPNNGRYRDDNVVVTLEFNNGSLGTLVYAANGDKAFSKERMEMFGGEAVAVLDDFRSLELVRDGRRRVYKSRLGQDKGHQGEWESFTKALTTGGPSPIPFEEIVATTLATFRISEALRSGEPVNVDVRGFMDSALNFKPSDVGPSSSGEPIEPEQRGS